ncbi:hypothetical protein [Alloactinosynnema sp. L-07]|uniref:hypothetical protein n=1 Tax=Alloactinosynnema sp. L-07 TaxID=1653480 RepID=UPI0012F8A470|nr:hypothetical protein [Alloactinosynnema sp. L-07]
MRGPESRRRRAVHLRNVPPKNPPTVPAPRSAGSTKQAPTRALSLGERFMLAAERALGGLAPTLHLALAIVAVAVVGLIVLAFTVGIVPAILGGLVLLAVIGRPR